MKTINLWGPIHVMRVTWRMWDGIFNRGISLATTELPQRGAIRVDPLVERLQGESTGSANVLQRFPCLECLKEVGKWLVNGL